MASDSTMEESKKAGTAKQDAVRVEVTPDGLMISWNGSVEVLLNSFKQCTIQQWKDFANGSDFIGPSYRAAWLRKYPALKESEACYEICGNHFITDGVSLSCCIPGGLLLPALRESIAKWDYQTR